MMKKCENGANFVIALLLDKENILLYEFSCLKLRFGWCDSIRSLDCIDTDLHTMPF